MEDLPPSFFIGHHESNRPLPVTAEIVQNAHAANYDMLTSPITTPHFHSRVLSQLSSSLLDHTTGLDDDVTRTRNASPITLSALTPADTPLTPDETVSQLIGTTSSWIDLASSDPIIADLSRQVLQLELTYAAFCGITYVLIPGPRLRHRQTDGGGITQYARAVLDALSHGPYIQFYLWMPMIDHWENDRDQIGDLAPLARPQYLGGGDDRSHYLDLFGTWEAWNVIRSVCNYHSRLSIALSLPKLLPPVAIQSRWYSEPVRILTLDANVFAKNAKGYPVLSRAHQALISRFVQSRTVPWFLLCDVGRMPHAGLPGTNGDAAGTAFPSLAEAAEGSYLKDRTPYLSYMRNLQTKQPIQSAVERFSAGYQDYLQAPLQPLTVNLESITYEVFEKDPIKYEWYERAIARALHDWIEQGKPTSNSDGRVVVAVVGAGRGPLVTRALKASEDVGVEIDMWALEKNPNAFVLLQRHNEQSWNRRVNLVKSDMRTWRGPVGQANAKHISRTYNIEPMDDTGPPPVRSPSATFTGSPETDSTYLLATATHAPAHYKIDILISELLGSFADNELSPECLDGVQHLLNPVHGISIPSSYSAHLTPIAAPKLHSDISHSMIQNNPQAAEIPYVVMLNAIDFLSTSDPMALPAPTTAQAALQNISYAKAHETKKSIPPNTISEPTETPPTPTPVIHQAWSFQHPNPSLPPPPTQPISSEPTISNAHNARHTSLTYKIANRGTCHGLAGYFETVLYDKVELSTNPNTMAAKSEAMISWFPIFFPLKSPVFVPDESEMTVNMWRRTDDRKVWYEWMVDVYMYVGSSSGKRKVRIGGSELHSSEKEACLM